MKHGSGILTGTINILILLRATETFPTHTLLCGDDKIPPTPLYLRVPWNTFKAQFSPNALGLLTMSDFSKCECCIKFPKNPSVNDVDLQTTYCEQRLSFVRLVFSVNAIERHDFHTKYCF